MTRRLCVILALLIAGCSVRPADEVAVYRDVLRLPEPPPDSAASLSLERAMFLANMQNEQLAARGEAYLRSEIAARRAKAAFFPTVRLAPSYAFRENTGSAGDNHSVDVPIQGSLTLFDGFGNVNSYWSSVYSAEARRNELLAAQQSLLVDVARVYFSILRSEATAEVLENSVRLQAERLTDARGRVEAGVEPPLVEAQVAAQLANTRTQLIDARRDIQVARQSLSLLIGVDASMLKLDADTLVDLNLPEDVGDRVRHALERRDELRAADAAIEAARRDVSLAMSQYYPSVTLDLSAFLYRDSSPTDRDWQGVLAANLPIFTAGRIHQDVRAAWSFAREAILVRNYVARQIEADVRSASAELESSNRRLAETASRLLAAQQAFDLAEASFNNGVGTNLDRLIAQDELLKAQLLAASERFDQQIFRIELKRATGELVKRSRAVSDDRSRR